MTTPTAPLPNTRVRVLQIVAGLDVGGVFGGAERFGLELARALDPARFDVRVCAFWRLDTGVERHWLDVLRERGIPVSFATETAPTRDLGAVRGGIAAIIARCRAEPLDVVHAHHEGGALAALLARRRGGARRAVRTIQVPLSREWGAGPGAAAMRAVCSRALFPLLLDAEIVVSQSHADALRDRVFARLARRAPQLIPSCISAEVMEAATVGARSPGRPPIIGSTGRLTHQKGYADLVEAALTVLREFPEARFVIYGEGELRAALQARIGALGLADRFTLPGQRPDVVAALREMDVFVLPSLWEGLPLALLDAMAMGVPAVATDISGNRDLLQHGAGWLVAPRDPAALAAAIGEAIREPNVRAAAAQVRVLAEYSPAAVARRHEALYGGMLGDGRAHDQGAAE